MPLHLRNTNVLNLQLRQVERKQTRLLQERINQTQIRYTELQEQLRRTVRQYYRHNRAMERVDRTLYMVKSGEEELITAALTRMRTAIEAQLELVRALEELYRRVNELFLTARVPFQLKLIKPVQLSSLPKRARLGERGIYLWSQEFNTISNLELLTFFDRKSISTVVLSAGRKTDQEKLRVFAEAAENRGLTVELMVGDNSWIYNDNFKKALERSIFTAERTGYLHYDIEPQAMVGYQKKRQEYIRLYTTLVTGVKHRLFDRKLSLSVPFHWPEATYKELGGVADKLYVMAYGSAEPKVLLRRLKPIIDSVPPDKIVIALNVEDFSDEWGLEKIIEQIIHETGLQQFCFHDVGRFIQQYGGENEAQN